MSLPVVTIGVGNGTRERGGQEVEQSQSESQGTMKTIRRQSSRIPCRASFGVEGRVGVCQVVQLGPGAVFVGGWGY